jgi:hypothetical protein
VRTIGSWRCCWWAQNFRECRWGTGVFRRDEKSGSDQGTHCWSLSRIIPRGSQKNT